MPSRSRMAFRDPEEASSSPSPRVDIPAAPRFEVGSLAWVRSERPELEDVLVTAAFHFLALPGTLAPDKARELGRALGREARTKEGPDILRAFSHVGLGA